MVPKVEKKLKELEEDSRDCSLIHTGKGEFDVKEGMTNFCVSLTMRTCTCCKQQITGLPCKHAVRCILRMDYLVEDCCDEAFTVERYKKLYDGIVYPIPNPCMWDKREDLRKLDPPIVERGGGRPPLHKRRESQTQPLSQPNTKGKIGHAGTLRCSSCKQIAHNKLGCGKAKDESGS